MPTRTRGCSGALRSIILQLFFKIISFPETNLERTGVRRGIFLTEDDEFDKAVYGMLGDAPVTCAWEAKLCTD